MKNPLPAALLIVTTLTCLSLAWSMQKSAPAKTAIYPIAHNTTDTLTIIGVGDMMLGTNYPNETYLPPNDGRDLLEPLKDILLNADVTFGNCEGTFLDNGGTVKQCSDPAKCYAFRQPVRYAKYLVDAGFDLISIANNHTGDFGDAGRNSTIKTLEEAGLKYAGLLSCPTTIFENNGVKYGLAAFAPNTGTVDIRDIEAAKKIVSQLSSQCNITIVSFHGGAEGADHKHVKNKTEIFLGEDRGNVVAFSHAVIDAGADVVFGHGPHITRAIELFNDRIIAYSLGNFCTYARFNLDGPNGMAPLLKIETDNEGRFLAGEIVAIKQEGEGGPQIDPDKKVVAEMIKLTSADFPRTSIIISPDGKITLKQP